MSMLRNSAVDALCIRFIEATVATEHVSEDIGVDCAGNGRITGIEVPGVRRPPCRRAIEKHPKIDGSLTIAEPPRSVAWHVSGGAILLAVSMLAIKTAALADSWRLVERSGRIAASADNVIVGQVNDSTNGDFVSLKYWELEDDGCVNQRMFGASCVDLLLDRSPPKERDSILASWRSHGATATITLTDSQKVTLSNLFVMYREPGNTAMVPMYPPQEPSLDIVGNGTKTTCRFSRIARLDKDGEIFRVRFRDGRVVRGRHSPPRFCNQPYRPYLYGVQYADDGVITYRIVEFYEFVSMVR
jgi:hypothetical protein